MTDRQEIPEDYSHPVSQLLELGRPQTHQVEDWPDYVTQYQLTPAHIPELKRMVMDEDLYFEDDDPRGYAFVHAMRALGQLRHEDALAFLIDLLEQDEGSDYIWEQAPPAIALFGPGAIPSLEVSLERTKHELSGLTVVSALKYVGTLFPEARDQSVAVLTACLEQAARNDPGLNASIIHGLVELRAMDSLPVIEAAFAGDHVDLMYRGDWEDVQIELGLLEERLTPRPKPAFPFTIPPDLFAPESDHSSPSSRQIKAKKKAKRKQAKQSRKQNRKKKRKKR